MEVSEELLNKILTYLGQKPYVEVAPLINAIAEAVKQARQTQTPPPAN